MLWDGVPHGCTACHSIFVLFLFLVVNLFVARIGVELVVEVGENGVGIAVVAKHFHRRTRIIQIG